MRAAHDLAVKLGKSSVTAMLRGMTSIEWRDWQIYLSLAPVGEERADIRAAQICQTIVNMWRDTKEHPQPIPLKDFLLRFGDDDDTPKKPVEEKQSVDEIFGHVSAWVAGSNQAIIEERHRGQYR